MKPGTQSQRVNKLESTLSSKQPPKILGKKQVMAPFNFSLKLPHCDECMRPIVISPSQRELDQEELFDKCLRCEKKVHKSHKQCMDSKTSFCIGCSKAFQEFKAKHFKKPKQSGEHMVDSKLQRFFSVKKGGPDKIELKEDDFSYSKQTKRVNPHKAVLLTTINEDSDGDWGYSQDTKLQVIKSNR